MLYNLIEASKNSPFTGPITVAKCDAPAATEAGKNCHFSTHCPFAHF
jgi:hypothetical protein